MRTDQSRHCPRILPRLLPVAVLLSVAGVVTAAAPAQATVIKVDTSADDEVVNNNCTFREAVTALNTRVKTDRCPAGNGSVDKIQLGVRWITLTVVKNIKLLRPVILEGSGYDMTNIDAGGRSIGIEIGDDAANKPSVIINNLTIRNTEARGLTVNTGSNATIEYVKIIDAGNGDASGSCLGIDPTASATLFHAELLNCEGHTGAGVVNLGTFTMRQTSIINARAEHGGAIANQGTANIYASTLAKNSAYLDGGAVLNKPGATIYLEGVTILNTSSGTGNVTCPAGINCSALVNVAGGTLRLKATILAQSTTTAAATTAHCAGTITSSGYNLLGEAASNCPKTATDITSNPFLQSATNAGDPGWPEDRGGVGRVYLPFSSSPAMARVPIADSYCRQRDQRGIARGRGAQSCGIGAAERSTVLFVRNTDGTANEKAWDTQMMAIFEELGFSVISRDDDIATTADANNRHLVFLSESVDSNKITTKYRDVGASVIVNEPSLYAAMKMTGATSSDFGDQTAQTGIRLTSQLIGNLAGVMGIDPINFPCFDTPSVVGWGVPTLQASHDGELLNNSLRLPLFQYTTSSLMVSNPNFFAPGHRTGFFGQPGSGFNEGGGKLIRTLIITAAVEAL